MSLETLQAAMAVAGVVFIAGGAFWQIQQLRRDLNGIGGKCNEDRRAAFRRYHNTSLALMLLAEKEQQKEIVALLKEPE